MILILMRIDLDEFRPSSKSLVASERNSRISLAMKSMFKLIDEDGSGGIDFEEMYDFLASNKSTKFNIATCITLQRSGMSIFGIH